MIMNIDPASDLLEIHHNKGKKDDRVCECRRRGASCLFMRNIRWGDESRGEIKETGNMFISLLEKCGVLEI